MKKWLIILMGLTLVAAVTTGAAFALTSNGSDTPVEGSEGQIDEPDGDLPPIRSDEDIDPNECNWIHNITACGDEVLEPSGDQPPVRIDDDMDPNECNWIHNITACEGEDMGSEDGVEPDQGIAVGEPYPDKGEIIGEPEPYPMPIPGTPVDSIPVSDVVCGPDQAVSITSVGQVSCWDLDPTKVDKDAEASPGMPPVVEPAL